MPEQWYKVLKVLILLAFLAGLIRLVRNPEDLGALGRLYLAELCRSHDLSGQDGEVDHKLAGLCRHRRERREKARTHRQVLLFRGRLQCTPRPGDQPNMRLRQGKS